MAAYAGAGQVTRSAQEHAGSGAQSAQPAISQTPRLNSGALVDLNPKNPAYLENLGGILALENKLTESSAFFEHALKLDPANLEVRKNLVTAQWRLLQQAKVNVQIILRARPNDQQSILLLRMISET